jgi:hypothetical protein
MGYRSKETNLKDHLLPPKPSNEIKTLRKIGYTLETSIADILDNSIAAKAKNIDIEIPISGNCEPYISITDDGIGMTNRELLENMRLGCKDPYEERELGDLGRFGSGMKTASFSQAKKLTVISKVQDKPINGAIWDIERIQRENKWVLSMLSEKEVSKITPLFIKDKSRTGTQVLWTNIDRYENLESEIRESTLHEDIVSIKRAIGVYFHRFLEVEINDKDHISEINIIVNGDKIYPIDPFMRKFDGYRETHSGSLRSAEGTTNIIIHNIPHPDRLKQFQLDQIGGLENYNSKQGFYIYRDRRLMIEGDWLGTHASGVLGNRARVQIDMTSKMDHLWGTDVKKASFQFPRKVLTKLRSLSKAATKDSKKDYKRRGRNTQVVNEFWDSIDHPHKKTTEYRIQASNLSLKKIFKSLTKGQRENLATYLLDLAKNLPLKHILYTMSNHPQQVKTSDDWKSLLEKIMDK